MISPQPALLNLLAVEGVTHAASPLIRIINVKPPLQITSSAIAPSFICCLGDFNGSANDIAGINPIDRINGIIVKTKNFEIIQRSPSKTNIVFLFNRYLSNL